MLNSVTIIGALQLRSSDDKRIRYLEVERYYSNFKESIIKDFVPLMNWNKDIKGEIFSLPDKSLVAIRGRLEVENKILVVVVETITYLGLKY